MQVIESISSLLLGLWMLTGVTLSDGSSANLSYCQKKDSYQFNADGTFESKKHFLQGTTCSAFPVNGKYRLSEDEKKIELFLKDGEKAHQSMGVVNVDERSLKLNIKGDIVTLTKAGSTSGSNVAAPPEQLEGKWMMIKNELIGETLSDCDKKSFMQFHADGKVNMEMHIMDNGDCQTDSEILPYHITTDAAFLIIEPTGQRPMVMKIAQLDENILVLEMGGGLVTFYRHYWSDGSKQSDR